MKFYIQYTSQTQWWWWCTKLTPTDSDILHLFFRKTAQDNIAINVFSLKWNTAQWYRTL